jgi:hypothetical protein
MFEELMSPDFLAPYRFVLNDFEELMNDPTFRAETLLRGADTVTHKERQLMRHMERIGALVENDLLDSDVILDYSADVIVQTWSRLKPLVLVHRLVSGVETMWGGFKMLPERASLNLSLDSGKQR